MDQISEANVPTRKNKWILIIVVSVIVIIAIGGGVYTYSKIAPKNDSEPVSQNSAADDSAKNITGVNSAEVAVETDSIENDLKSVDGDITSADSELKSATDGLNDQPVDLN